MTTNWTPKKPRVTQPRERGPRLTMAEARNRMLRQAREVVWARGLTAEIQHLSLEEVIADAEVPRSSAFRIWRSKADFVEDVLAFIAGPDDDGLRAAAFDAETLRVAQEVVENNRDRLGDPDGCRAVVREAIRLGARRNLDALATSPYWRSYLTLLATVSSIEDQTRRGDLARRLYEAERSFLVLNMAEFYRAMAATLKFRLRSGLAWEHLAVAGAAVVEGISLRELLLPHVLRGSVAEEGEGTPIHDFVQNVVPGPSIDGGTTDWNIAALGFLAIFESFTEPDNDAWG